MITEDYVSCNIAKLLKEKGFDENCAALYHLRTGEIIQQGVGYVFNNSQWENFVSAPTLQMAMKWLEEKYGIFCVIRRHGNKDDGFTYSWNCEGKRGLSVGNGGEFKTAEEAREACIKYCLENLI